MSRAAEDIPTVDWNDPESVAKWAAIETDDSYQSFKNNPWDRLALENISSVKAIEDLAAEYGFDFQFIYLN